MSEVRQPVRVSAQVVAFVRAQAPESRRRLRLAVRGLERGRGDIKALEGGLIGYHRLRVGAYRIIFRYDPTASGRPGIACVCAEQRSLVYLLLEDLLARSILTLPADPRRG